MFHKKILIPIVIVLLIGVAAASYQFTTTTPGIWQPSVSQAQTSVDHGSASSSGSGSGISGTQSISSPKNGSGESDVKILPSEAKSIVQQNILVPGFKAGTPNLTTLNGKIVYYVPIVNGTTQAGEMYIDAKTGDILEGAGGVDNGSNG
ncbi:MAG TPA: PepSY domain-containing protein [Methanobacterium sp.]